LKYLIVYEYKEPVIENFKKAAEILKERREKGETLSDITVFPLHGFLSEFKAMMILETDDPKRITKWETDYLPVFKYKVMPILPTKEWPMEKYL
jgi:hypothetical protein